MPSRCGSVSVRTEKLRAFPGVQRLTSPPWSQFYWRAVRSACPPLSRAPGGLDAREMLMRASAGFEAFVVALAVGVGVTPSLFPSLTLASVERVRDGAIYELGTLVTG